MNSVFAVQGYPDTYKKLTSTNAAQGLPASMLHRSDSETPIAAFITCETNPVHVLYEGTDASQTDGHPLAVGQWIRLESQEAILNFSFASLASGVHGVIKITPEYAKKLGY